MAKKAKVTPIKIIPKAKVELSLITSLTAAIGAFYDQDPLTPGITLATLKSDLSCYGSINRYIKSNKDSGITRITLCKTRASSFTEVLELMATEWINLVTRSANLKELKALKRSL